MNKRMIFGILFFCIGIGIFIYIGIASRLDQKRADNIIETRQTQNIDYSALEKKIADYNDSNKLPDILGFIEIPSLDIRYPIYRGCDDTILEKGIGHLEYSAVPDKKTNGCFLMGHNGIVGKDLFTHIDRLDTGDLIYITITDERYVYEVTDHIIITPEELDEIDYYDSENRDLALVTCYPYAVNNQRYVVRCNYKGLS